jgi:hypothetical protein
MRNSLYKYFDERRWAEAFLDGAIRFQSLAYYRDYEDAEVRRDVNEGNAIYQPAEGLELHNQTQGTRTVLPNSRFEAVVKQDEVFVLCLTRGMTDERRARFHAVACVEITRIAKFCARLEAALPAGSNFFAGRVAYYEPHDDPNPHWALPDLIALRKQKGYEWQGEYRMFFSTTDALDFEKAQYRIVTGTPDPPPKPNTYPEHHVKMRDLRDICRLHSF